MLMNPTMDTQLDLRDAFLGFFKNDHHTVMKSSPLVTAGDPTLMFVNAGMVPFKEIFTGQRHSDTRRAATCQKCMRVSGKHNDLEEVGKTPRHHTLFEMLGNFSFGDYFKEEAIFYAWNFLTKELGIDKDKLLVTVYHNDDEAANFWKKIANLTDEKIIRIATDDNFWSMGDVGPCGPCSEIFYDHGDKIFGGPPGSKDQDGDRFIEIWNLVFMQFEKKPGSDLIPLPKPCIDTGMGLERVTSVIQGVCDNYETDSFKNLISEIQKAV